MKLYYAEGSVGSYWLSAIDTTPTKAINALKRYYKEHNLQGWKSDLTASQWVEYQGITAWEMTLGEVLWK